MSHHEETSALLREHGCRVTPQRLLILDVLRRGREHLSAEDIYGEVTARFPGVDLSTVYRTLELLTKLGLARQTDLGAGHIHYEWPDEPDHHHLVCQDCGRVLHIGDQLMAEVRQALEREYDFHSVKTRLTVFGHCKACACN